MGNVRPEKVKRVARDLFTKYPSKFTTDFEQNKEILKSIINTQSKSLRNTIAGYITRLAIISQPKTSDAPLNEEND
ncbi:MAG: 30S ribosomal protein S17e [Candidatus Bathyarchaeia archaeon]|nr:30S ribosomal protein S17e [Candidatus Bathyarchaeota archaeon]